MFIDVLPTRENVESPVPGVAESGELLCGCLGTEPQISGSPGGALNC